MYALFLSYKYKNAKKKLTNYFIPFLFFFSILDNKDFQAPIEDSIVTCDSSSKRFSGFFYILSAIIIVLTCGTITAIVYFIYKQQWRIIIAKTKILTDKLFKWKKYNTYGNGREESNYLKMMKIKSNISYILEIFINFFFKIFFFKLIFDRYYHYSTSP